MPLLRNLPLLPKSETRYRVALLPFILALVGASASAQTASTNTTRDSVIVFNEIHFQPAGDDSSLEYVELYNQLVVDVDMSNWRIDGIGYDFPEGTVIGGQEYLVIAKDPAALSSATGHSGAVGPFAGTLSNSGETLRIYNNNRSFRADGSGGASGGTILDSLEGRRVMDEISYADNFPWPVAPDGSGVTLAKIDPTTGSAHPTNWSHSTTANGSPGSANITPTTPSLTINEISASTATNFQIELFNNATSSISLGGLVIASSNPLNPDYILPGGSLNTGDFTTISSTALGYTPADNERLFLFTAGKNTLLSAVRIDDQAQARHPDGTGPWLRPNAPTFGSANSFDIEDAIVINEIFYNAYPIRATPGSEVEVFDFDQIWRYNLDAGAPGLPAGWANSAHVVDNVSWAQGPGLLGRELGTLDEPIRTDITLSTKVTYYFETEFTLDAGLQVDTMEIDHFIDDAAVFYLNGVELGRTSNMPSGEILPTTVASSSVSDASLQTISFTKLNILPGTNRFSVEVHQSNAGSNDLVFGAKVTLQTSTPFQEREEEWLELHNRSASAVDLTGWEISGGIRYEFPFETSIPANGYLVVAKDSSALSSKHPGASIIGDYDGRLGGGGDQIILEDALGNPADEVTYFDSRKWHSEADGNGSSLELIDPDSDNSKALAWAPSDESARTSWQSYSYSGVAADLSYGVGIYNEFILSLLDAGEVLVDDISVIENGSTQFIQNQDFESDTPGSQASSWRALGTHGSHGRTVVITDPEDAGNQCLHLVATGATDNNHNKVETTLANNQTVVSGNTYTISFRAKFLSGSNQLNTRLFFNYLPKTTLLETPEIWGTPGTVNSVALANAGPTLETLSHSPVVPNAGQATTVTIAAADADGINDLRVFYSVNDGNFQSVAMSPGTDGTYSGNIPGQSASAIVRFYVRARDTSNATTFFPAEGNESGALYKVQDNLADNSGVRHNFRIVMAPSDRTLLFLDTNRMSNDRIPVTVIEDETTVYYNVGLRLKASAAGRYIADRYGFNIAFQPDDLFRGVHSSIAIERAANEDIHEILTKHILNRASGYWSYYDDVANIITPTVSDSGPGLLSMSRNTGNFLDALYPDSDGEGLLFNHEIFYNSRTSTGGVKTFQGDPQFIENDFRDRGTDKENYRLGFQARNQRGRDDFSQITALNQAISNLSGTALKEAIEPIIDVDQWMRSFAMLSLTGSNDMIGRLFAHNVRYYVRPTDGKMILLIWDNDNAYRINTSSSLPPTKHVTKLFAIPEFRRIFDGHLKDIIETTYNSNYISPWVSHFRSVTGPSSTSKLSYINTRSNFVLGQLSSPVTFAITTNGGADFEEPSSTVDLVGNGWIDVFSIQVNGVPTDITWSGTDTWQITVPIPPGDNPLTLTAFNNQGVAVGTDSITVTNTSPATLADITNTIISELHYHPADPSAAEIAAGFDDPEQFEFVEITNTSTSDTIDFTAVKFTIGVSYEFPAGTTLAPGGRLLLVSDQAAFATRYPGIPTLGQYSGNFRNSGEQVRLEAANADMIADFTYGDSAPWPDSADGDGFSLVFNGSDPTLPSNWRPSTSIGGNPNSSDSTPFPGGDLLSYLVANGPSANFTNDSFSLSVDLNLGADAATIRAQFSTDLDTWTDAPVGTVITQVNNGDGTRTMTVTPLDQTSSKIFGRFVVELR
ncbi:lamin tail domain-containing protein [bacterium]|nr:lamin tail domain-containing protein [bacterium]